MTNSEMLVVIKGLERMDGRDNGESLVTVNGVGMGSPSVVLNTSGGSATNGDVVRMRTGRMSGDRGGMEDYEGSNCTSPGGAFGVGAMTRNSGVNCWSNDANGGDPKLLQRTSAMVSGPIGGLINCERSL